MQRPRIAVIGAGYWGQNLVRNLGQLERLGAVCDASPDVRRRMAAAWPGVTVTDDLEQVLADPDIAGVMVAVPAAQHHAVARRCLLAGKHTYVEKPLALTVEDGEDLVRLADDRGLALMVGHLLLYHPCTEWLKAAIDRGDLGQVLYLTSQRVNLGKVRTDENAMWSLAPHDVSMALHLVGAAPVSVAAQGLTYLQPRAGIEDVVFLTLRFPGGQAAHIHVSWLDPHKRRQLTVVGSRKMVTFDDMEPSEKVRVYDKGVDGAGLVDAPPYESYGDLLTLRDGDILIPQIKMREPLRALCQHFVQVAQGEAAPRTDGRNGLDVLRVLAAAQRSLELGGAPVSLEVEAAA